MHRALYFCYTLATTHNQYGIWYFPSFFVEPGVTAWGAHRRGALHLGPNKSVRFPKSANKRANKMNVTHRGVKFC